MLDAQVCLWCGQPSSEAPEEHIIPEALGCPPEAIFRSGEVCGRCNNRISWLDNVLADAFDIPRFMYGQPAKKRRPPSIAGRPNVRATQHVGERTLFINFGPGDVTLPTGHKLKAPSKNPRSVHGTFKREGDLGTVTGTAEMFTQPEFPRAMHKIAIETIALSFGVGTARAEVYRDLREYVLSKGETQRRILMRMPSEELSTSTFANQLGPVYTPDDGGVGCVVPIKLFSLDFLVDCTPSQSFTERFLGMRQFSPKEIPWRVIPWENKYPTAGVT
jgi:hypothetical protein